MGKLYKILSYLSGPFLRIYFYSRCLYGKDNWTDVVNHFGQATKSRPKGRLIWVHAASVGESAAAMTYIKHVKKLDSELNVLLTTITVTSASIISADLQTMPGCIHQFAVADNPFWINDFLDYWKPERVFLLESEIWPNIIESLHARHIPLFLLNARISTKSVERWSKCKEMFSSLLQKFTAILAQSDQDKHKFQEFSPNNVYKIDNLKYANDVLPANPELLGRIKKICANKKVLVAVSTHASEEETIIKAHLELKKEFDVFTIIIPRHLTRIGEITKMFRNYQVDHLLVSKFFTIVDEQNGQIVKTPPSVLCIDKFGEVGTCLRIADAAFIGGSLIPVGGHNAYEAIALGKPVLFGPYMENAIDVKNMILANQLGFEVKSDSDIADHCRQIFSDKAFTDDIAERCKTVTHNESLQQIDRIVGISVETDQTKHSH